MFDRLPRYRQYDRKQCVFNEAFVEQNIQNEDDFAQECVRIHNHYRAQHGCPPLQLSYSVCAISQEWANRISAEDHFHHSNHPQYGENLFVIYMSNSSLPRVTAQQVVESWYSEHVFYPFEGHTTRDIISKAGHFTQVIWSGSRELGIGKAVSKNNRLYVVANYYPAGNVLRKFEENVPPKIHNVTHSYNRRISSRRLDMDSSMEKLYVPQYHRVTSRQLDNDFTASTKTLHVPHHYTRKISNRQPDFDISEDTLFVPRQYARKVSSRQLGTSIETLHVPQLYERKNSSKKMDSYGFSAETLHVPPYHTRRNSSKHIDESGSVKTLYKPHHNNQRLPNRQYDFDDPTDMLFVPQYYTKRTSSRQLSIES